MFVCHVCVTLTLQKAGQLGVTVRDMSVGFPELVTESTDHISKSQETFVDINTCGIKRRERNAFAGVILNPFTSLHHSKIYCDSYSTVKLP